MNNVSHEVQIQTLSHEGRGIANIQGKKVFIDNALPNETVKFVIKRKHRRFDEGLATEILQASPDRISPLCNHFNECGGCQLQHLDPNKALLLKQNVLLEQLKHFGNIIPEAFLPPLQGPIFHYRRKARLGVKFVTKKNKLLIGFREKSCHKITDLSQCEILEPRIGHLITTLQELISSLKAYQSIPQIEVAIGDTEAALVFRNLTALEIEDIEKLTTFAKLHQLQIYCQPSDPDSITAIWPKAPKALSYQLNLTKFNINEPLHFHFQPLDFIQVNRIMNQKMVARALELLDITKEDIILDLFCGLGNFSLPLAKLAKKVVGVEGSQGMVERAKSNAKLNQIDNIEFFALDLQSKNLEGNLKNIDANWALNQYDKILIDPPRTGALEILPLISTLHPKKILYVSCNPATLARDIGILVEKYQFTLKAVGVLDMFPNTLHVESMALLEKN